MSDINNAAIAAIGYLYLAGAFVSWCVVSDTVAKRPLLAAFWFILLPFDLLCGELGQEDDSDDNDDYGV